MLEMKKLRLDHVSYIGIDENDTMYIHIIHDILL